SSQCLRFDICSIRRNGEIISGIEDRSCVIYKRNNKLSLVKACRHSQARAVPECEAHPASSAHRAFVLRSMVGAPVLAVVDVAAAAVDAAASVVVSFVVVRPGLAELRAF